MKMEADDFGRNDVNNNPQPNNLQNEAARELSSHIKVIGDRAVIVDPVPKDTVGIPVGQTDTESDMSATIYVRSKASLKEMDDTIAKIQSHEVDPLSEEEFNEKFGADPASMARVQEFAKDNGFTIVECELDS